MPRQVLLHRVSQLVLNQAFHQASIRIMMYTSSQEYRSYLVVTAEAAEAPVAMQNFVPILGPDILGDIFEFLTSETIRIFSVAAHNKGDIVSLRSINDAFENWRCKRLTYCEKNESLTDLHLSHALAFEIFINPTKSTVVDNIFEYLSENDISNLKHTDMLSDDPEKNPFYLKDMKLESAILRRQKKLREYLGIDDPDAADADADEETSVKENSDHDDDIH